MVILSELKPIMLSALTVEWWNTFSLDVIKSPHTQVCWYQNGMDSNNNKEVLFFVLCEMERNWLKSLLFLYVAWGVEIDSFKEHIFSFAQLESSAAFVCRLVINTLRSCLWPWILYFLFKPLGFLKILRVVV